MKVITVAEENHGLICIATNIKSAIKELFKTEWLHANIEFFDWENDKMVTIVEKFGNGYQEKTANYFLSIEDFNDAFDGEFYMNEDVLVGAD